MFGAILVIVIIINVFGAILVIVIISVEAGSSRSRVSTRGAGSAPHDGSGPGASLTGLTVDRNLLSEQREQGPGVSLDV